MSESIRLEILAHGVPASLLGEYEEAIENERKEPPTAEGYIELVHRHIREMEDWKARAMPSKGEECPYCREDGLMTSTGPDDGRVCPYCKGKHWV